MPSDVNIGNVFVGVKANMKDFTEGLKRGENSLKGLGLKMSAVGAGITAAIGLMVNSTAKMGDEFDKTSIRIGVSVENLSTLAHAAELSGANFADVNKGMLRLAKNMSDAKAGMKIAQDAFNELGISTQNMDGSLRDVNDVFLEAADKIANMEDKTRATAISMEIFGKSGNRMLPMLKAGAAGIKEMQEEAKALGLEMSTETSKASALFIDNLTRIQGAGTGFKNQLSEALLPALNAFTGIIVILAKEFMAFAKEHKNVIAGITIAIGAFGSLLAILGPIVLLLPQIVAGFGILSTALGAISAPVLGIVAGFVTLGGIIIGVMTNLFGLQDMFKGVINWIQAKLFAFVDVALSRLGFLLELIGVDVEAMRATVQAKSEEAAGSATENFSNFSNKMKEDWEGLKNSFKSNMVEDEDSIANTAVVAKNTIKEQFGDIPPTLIRVNEEVTTSITKTFVAMEEVSRRSVEDVQKNVEGQANAIADILVGDSNSLSAVFMAAGVEMNVANKNLIGGLEGDWKGFLKWYLKSFLVSMLTGTQTASGGILGSLSGAFGKLFGGGKGGGTDAGKATGVLGSLASKIPGGSAITGALGSVGAVASGIGLAVGGLAIGKKILGSLFGKKDVNKFTGQEEEEAYFIIGSMLGVDVPQGNAKNHIRAIWKREKTNGRSIHDWFKKYWQPFVDKYGSRKGGSGNKQGAISWLEQQMERDGIIEKSLRQTGGGGGLATVGMAGIAMTGTSGGGGGGIASLGRTASRAGTMANFSSSASTNVVINNPIVDSENRMREMAQSVSAQIGRQQRVRFK